MKTFLIFLLSFSAVCLADIKLSQLPLTVDSTTIHSLDTFPYTDSNDSNNTKRMYISGLPTTPAFTTKFNLFAPKANPVFTGTVTGNFSGPLTGNVTGNLTGNVTGTASGNTTYTPNHYGLLYSGAANVLGVLPPDSSTAKTLISGGASAVPSWGVLSIAGGGTGQVTSSAAFNALSPLTTVGDLIYGGASGVGTRLSGNNLAATKFLSQIGDGVNAGAPAWSTISSSDLPTGNLTDVGTDGIVVTSGSNAVVGSGTSLAQHVSDSTHNGYLSSTDWSTFNNKQSALTIGNLSDAGTDGIIVTNGASSVIGSGTSFAQRVSDSTHNGYLSSTDWSTFNGKQASGNYITALTGDVTASGPGSVAATLAATSNATLTTLSGLTTASALATVGTITSGTWSATTIGVTKGGTGLTTLTTGNVILGAGTSTPTFVAPSTSGNVLTSNGSTWTSAPAVAGNPIYAKYAIAGAGVAISATQPVDFATQIFDSNSAVTTGSAWKFTAPSTKIYHVDTCLITSLTSFTFLLYKNGTLNTTFATTTMVGGYSCGSTLVSLSATDYIDIRSDTTATVGNNTGLAISIYSIN